ncbi:MAG: adenylyl-sulfate kinase [Gemmatimonadetes bacterium]|nr:adenylyl-sulfate kinase [Gemmatimonadota bacterium]
MGREVTSPTSNRLAPLRLVLCGSVDDGKSTLIGRMLYDSNQVFADQLGKVEADSRRWGTQGENIDLALLLDGLQDEREQGITIDVAYRSLETPRRRFIVADVPGHEQYTRNMATGASTAQVAIILVNARRGILPQTARHTRIAAMFGVRHVVLAVNKMDLVDWDQATFEALEEEYRELTDDVGVPEVVAMPVSGLTGDNLTRRSDNMPWYDGPTLLEHLETVQVTDPGDDAPFRMPVQYVNRPHSEFRGYCGRVASGTVKPGQRIRVVPGSSESPVKSVLVGRGEVERAGRGDSVTLTFSTEIDVTRGDVIADAEDAPAVSDQFRASILWMGEQPLVAGRLYLLKMHTREVTAKVTSIRHSVEVRTGERLAAKQLELNEIGVVNLATSRPVPFAPFEENGKLGGFILVDRGNNRTVAAGTISYALMRAANVTWQQFDISREVRAQLKRQDARCLWFTGLSASGKSTVANLLERRLYIEGRHTYLLDGDNVRHGLNADLGFTEIDRTENIRRVAEVARLMVDAGLIVIVSFISPFRADREMARGLFEPGEFLEVFIDASAEECARRDPKGLYAKALRGEIKNFTGISSPYERPEEPEIHLSTEELSPEDCVEELLRKLN